MYSQSVLLSFQLALSLTIVKTKPHALSLEEWLQTIKSLFIGPSSDAETLKEIGKTFPQVKTINARLEIDESLSPWKLPRLLRAMRTLQEQVEQPEVDVSQFTRELIQTACLAKSSVSSFMEIRIRNEHRSSQKLMDSVRRELSKLLSVVASVIVLMLSAFTKLQSKFDNAQLSNSHPFCPVICGIVDIFDTVLDVLSEVSNMVARQIQRTGIASDSTRYKVMATKGRSKDRRGVRNERESRSSGDASNIPHKLVTTWVNTFLAPLSGAFVLLTESPSATTNHPSPLEEQLRLSLLGSLLLRCGRLVNLLVLYPYPESPYPSSDTIGTINEPNSKRAEGSRSRRPQGPKSSISQENRSKYREEKDDQNLNRLARQIEGSILVPLLKLLHFNIALTERRPKSQSLESNQFLEIKRSFQRTLIEGIFGQDGLEDNLAGMKLSDYLRNKPKDYDEMVREAEKLIRDDDFDLVASAELPTERFVDRLWELCGWEILEEGWDQTADFVTMDDTQGELLQDEIETENDEL